MAEYKQWRNEDRTYLKDVVPLETPYNIKVEVSSLCNARCVYCAHSKPDHGGVWAGNMTTELFEKVLRDIKEFPQKPKQMETYMFGEPLCNPLLPQMIGRAKQENVVDKITFTTNGLLFTPEKVDAIIAAGVDIIRISLQGLDAQAYQKTCGVKMNFDKFIENLSYLYKNKGKCQIRMKIADVAIKNVPDGDEKFKQIFGSIADSIFVEHILPLFCDLDYDKIDKSISNDVMRGRSDVATSCIHKVCHRPFFRVRVAANGLVTSACCDTPHDIVYGDIAKESLYDIWNGEKHKAFLKMQLQGKRFMHPSCKNCIAANDITTEADILDPYAEEILKRF